MTGEQEPEQKNEKKNFFGKLKEIKGKLEKDVALKSTVDDIIKNINES